MNENTIIVLYCYYILYGDHTFMIVKEKNIKTHLLNFRNKINFANV